MAGDRFPAGTTDFSLLHSVESRPPSLLSNGYRRLLRDKAAGSWNSQLTSFKSSVCLSRDRSIASSKLSSPKSAILSLSPDEASRIFFGETVQESYTVVVFPFAFHIVVQQPLKPLWSRLLLCDHEPSQPTTVLCFMSLLMSPLQTSGEFL
jgi:hypothetical protein